MAINESAASLYPYSNPLRLPALLNNRYSNKLDISLLSFPVSKSSQSAHHCRLAKQQANSTGGCEIEFGCVTIIGNILGFSLVETRFIASGNSLVETRFIASDSPLLETRFIASGNSLVETRFIASGNSLVEPRFIASGNSLVEPRFIASVSGEGKIN